MGKTYQVVAAAAMVTQNTPNGPMKMLMYRGHVLGPGLTDAEIAHNVAGGYIREVGAADEPVDDGLLPPAGGDAGQGDGAGDGAAVGSESETARADAKAKLPVDGSAPPKNAATAVWIEYAVAKGYLYDDCVKETRETLISLTESK